jgi:NAD(P)-dependent dehydrogenase (short-subunit alcohol dehydrogenase family)
MRFHPPASWKTKLFASPAGSKGWALRDPDKLPKPQLGAGIRQWPRRSSTVASTFESVAKKSADSPRPRSGGIHDTWRLAAGAGHEPRQSVPWDAAGIKALSGNAAYGTSKAAVRFFTRIAALEGAPQHIRVNSISPGAIATPMWESTDLWPKQVAAMGGREAALKALVKDRGFAEPEEVAAAVLFLASNEARHVTGADFPVDDCFAIT